MILHASTDKSGTLAAVHHRMDAVARFDAIDEQAQELLQDRAHGAATCVATSGSPADRPADAETEGDGLNATDRGFLLRFRRAISLLHCDPELRLTTLSLRLAVSERVMQRKVKALLGCRPVEYLRSYRLYQARPLLAAGWQVGRVVESVGFSGQAYFACCFKAEFGLRPTEYRAAQLALQRQRGWRPGWHLQRAVVLPA